MDWSQILINCIIWVIGVVVFFAGLYAVIVIPMALMMLAVGAVWHVLRLFLPFLPDFWAAAAKSAEPRKKGFDWSEKTEADKHRELVGHIRIQHMNEERNRR